MVRVPSGVLSDMAEPGLYRLLGEAWYANFKPKAGEAYLLDSPVRIGKREFDELAPMLRHDLRQPYDYGVVACVAETIRRRGHWPMPMYVVAALVVRLGLDAPANVRQEIHPAAL
jgi:hypothetical protein